MTASTATCITPDPNAAPPAGADPARAERFAERVGGMINDGAVVVMVALGHQLGLFDAMAAAGRRTSEQLADRTEPSDASPTCWAASGDNDAGPDPFAPIFSVQTGERSVAVRWDPRFGTA